MPRKLSLRWRNGKHDAAITMSIRFFCVLYGSCFLFCASPVPSKAEAYTEEDDDISSQSARLEREASDPLASRCLFLPRFFPVPFFSFPCLLVSLSPCPSFAAPGESLPPYHYLMGPLEDLRLRGCVPDLDVPIFPYGRQTVTRDIIALDSLFSLPHSPCSPSRWMWERLQEGLVSRDRRQQPRQGCGPSGCTPG